MISDRHRARQARRSRIVAAAATLAVAGALVLAGCGSSGAGRAAGPASASGSSAGDPGAAPSARSTAIPTQNVVSFVKEDPKLNAGLPASVRSSGQLILGTTLQPGTAGLPYAGQVDGQNVGLDVDLENAVAKVLGVRLDVQNGTFDTIIPGVQNGRYQVGLDNFGVTSAREKVVDFATYLNDGQSFLGSSSVSVSAIKSITDACGYTIATSPGTTFQTLLTGNASKCAAAGKQPWSVQYFSDTAPIFLGLENGKVDLFFGPTLSLRYDAVHIAGTKFLGQVSSTPVGFVTAKGSPIAKALSAAVNELIANGDYAKIFDKWGVSGSEVASSTLNPSTTF